MSLDFLLLPEPPPGQRFEIPASHWNRLAREIQRRAPQAGSGGVKRRPFRHPFKVSAARWDGGRAHAWRVDLRPGTANDQMVVIPYLKERDPRGWTMPSDHPGRPVAGVSVDRSLLEVDPPFLLVSAPEPGKSESEDFVAVSARPPFFQTEERLAKTLFRAHVMVSAEPRHISRGLEVQQLRRFRAFAGRRPAATVSSAGGYAEIARLWILRGDDPAEDEMLVQQLIFWPFGSIHNQPQSVIPDDFSTGIGFADLILGMVREREAAALEEAGSIEFWTQ